MTATTQREQAELRRDAYKQVRQYVLAHCHVLVSIWDGEPPRGRADKRNMVKEAQNRLVF